MIIDHAYCLPEFRIEAAMARINNIFADKMTLKIKDCCAAVYHFIYSLAVVLYLVMAKQRRTWKIE